MPGQFLPIIVAVSAAAAQPTPARGNLSALFTGDDYPLIALRKEEQGVVKVRLGVDTDGMVSSCKVIVSSGSQALDNQTCAVLRARAQFVPARDARGKPIQSDWTQSIRWNIAGDAPPQMPRHAWQSKSTFAMSKDGKLVSCNVEYTGFTKPPADCEEFSGVLGKSAASDTTAIPAVFMITELFFYPVDPSQATEAPKLGDANLVARQTSRVTINASGVVTDCEGVSFAGEASPETDVCILVRNTVFEARAVGSEDQVATFVITGYIRRQTVS